MRNNKQFALPILITVLLVILIVSFRSFLLTNIIEPIALLFWAFWRIITSVNQHVYWMALIVLCSMLFLRLFPSGDNKSSRSAYNDRGKSLNRVEHWQTLMKDSVLGNDKSRRLHDSLKDLLISIVAQGEEGDPIELEEFVAKGKVPLSLATQQYLYPPVERHGKFHLNQKINIMSLAPRWLRKWRGKFVHQDYTSIDEILRWMETELEIDDEK